MDCVGCCELDTDVTDVNMSFKCTWRLYMAQPSHGVWNCGHEFIELGGLCLYSRTVPVDPVLLQVSLERSHLTNLLALSSLTCKGTIYYFEH